MNRTRWLICIFFSSSTCGSDALWSRLCWAEYGGRALLDRLGVMQGFHAFHIRHRRALAAHQAVLRPAEARLASCTAPPESFFEVRAWVWVLVDYGPRSALRRSTVAADGLAD